MPSQCYMEVASLSIVVISICYVALYAEISLCRRLFTVKNHGDRYYHGMYLLMVSYLSLMCLRNRQEVFFERLGFGRFS